MASRRKQVKASWLSPYAREGSNQRFLDEIESYDRDLQREIQDSADRTARIEYDIEQIREDRRRRDEDPEGYFYDKEQEALERGKKTLGNYLKNWWASHGRKMNDFLAQDFQGYIDRANLWKSLADRVSEYWDIEDEIKNIDSQLKQWRLNTQNISSAPVEKIREAYGVIDQLETQKEALTNRLKELAPSVDAFKSYIPGALKTGLYDIVAGNGEGGIFSDNFIFGRTSQLHDELGDITRFTSSMFSPNRSRGEQRAMMAGAMHAYDAKLKEWQKGVDANIKDRESYDKVDRWFEKREQQAGTDIFDSNTWLYGMPGLIAGSTSGLSKIIPATLIGIGTGIAAGATGGLAGLAITGIGGAEAFGFNYGAGVSENNSEVAMAYTERLEDYLKNKEGLSGSLYDDIIKEGRRKLGVGKEMSDEQVFEQYRKGVYTINNAAANKEMQRLAIGIENLMQDDMAATTWSAGLETVLQVLPVGRALSIPKAIRYQMLKTAGRREGLRNAAKKAAIMAKGYEVGAVASPVAGALYAPVHLAVSPAIKRLGRLGKGVIDDIARSAWMVDDIPGRALVKKFQHAPKLRYLKDISGRWIASSIAESIEEGKQNISANRYKSGEYSSEKIKSIGETILDDFLAGSKSAGLLLGMPFEGLMSETDRRTLQEMKGGLILGGLLTGVVNTAQSIAPYRKEQKVNTAIANAVLLDKAVKLDNFNKAKIYAEAAKSQAGYQNIKNGFDRLRQMNDDEYASTGEYGIPTERIDEEVKRFEDIAKMANDAYTIKQATSQKIDPSSKEYEEFVGAKQVAIDELKSAEEVVAAATKNFSDVKTELMERAFTSKLSGAALVGELNDEKPNPVAEHTSVEDFNQMENVARYSALLRRKQQLEVGIMNAQYRGHNKIKSILQGQLEDINNNIINLKKVISTYVKEGVDVDVDNLESIETSLVLNKEDHDNLSEAYKDMIVADQDFDLAMNQYERVIGKARLNGKPVDIKQKVDWGKEFDNVTFVGGDARSVIKEIRDTINDDNDLVSSIDEDFEDRTDENGEEIITEQQADEAENTPLENDPVQEFKNEGKEEQAPEQPTQLPSPVQQTQPIQSTVRPLIQPQPESQTLPEPTPVLQTLPVLEPELRPMSVSDIPDLSTLSDDQLSDLEDTLLKQLERTDLSDEDRKTIANTINKISRDLIKKGYRKTIRNAQISSLQQLTDGEKNDINQTINQYETLRRLNKRNQELAKKKNDNVVIHTTLKDGNYVSTIKMVKVGDVYTNTESQFFAFDIPDEYEVDPASIPNGVDGDILGISELKEAADFSSQSAKLVVRDSNGALSTVDVNLIRKGTQNKPVEAPIKPVEPVSPVQPTIVPEAPQPAVEQHKSAAITPKQQDVLNAIKEKAEASARYVKEVTKDYYLIEVDGKEIKMPRVHSIMPRYWAGESDYMAALQVGNVFDNLARIFLGDARNLREFETNPDAVVDRLFNQIASHKNNPNDPSIERLKDLLFRDLFSSRDEFKNTIEDLYNLGIQYERLHWKLSTNPIVWYSRLNDGWVAGETDMLAVDQNGNIHIIDFKTAKLYSGGENPFVHYERSYTYNIPQEFKDELLTLDESDFTQGPRKKGLSKAARDFIKKLRRNGITPNMTPEQKRSKIESNRNLKVVWDGEIKQAVIKYISSNYTTDSGRFRKHHIYNNKIKISKEDEYSDLLTAYKNLVLRNLTNVEDMEVLPFAAKYTVNGKDLGTITSVRNQIGGKPFRIKVSESEEMNDMFNSEGDAPKIEPEPAPVPKAEDNKQQEEKIETQQLASQTRNLPVNPQPEVVQPSSVQPRRYTPSNSAPSGNSNLNPTVLNRDHKDLEQGIIFDRDFINEALRNGSVELYGEDVKGIYTIYANVEYKGKKYNRIFVYATPELQRKIEQLQANKQENQKIVATSMSRTGGEITKGEFAAAKDAKLFDVPVESLQFNSEGGIGYVKNDDLVTFIGNDPNTQDIIYTFTKKGRKNGSIYYLKKLKRSEGDGKEHIVPVELGRKILKDDVDFIVDCLKNINTINLPYSTIIKGKQINTGISKKDLLSLMMPYVEDLSQSGNVYSLVRDRTTPSVFYVVKDKKPLLSVDTRSELSINNFKQQLSSLPIEEDHTILASKLSGNSQPAVFKQIEKFFRNNRDGITSLKISNSLEFNAEDFKNGGISGFAWYVKNGIFVTDYDGLEKPFLRINDVGYILAEKPKTHSKQAETAPENDIPKQGGFSLSDISIANWGGKKGAQQKRKTDSDKNKPVLREAEIKKHLRPILGDLVDDPSVVRIVSTMANDPRVENACVVGKASSDAITLYGGAFTGVDYHEAFHRIFELFVPKNLRESIYEKAAKANKIDLSQSNESNDFMGHRLVAEWLADKYMDFRRYNWNTGIEWLDRIVNMIIDLARAIRHIGNYKLYMLFLDINSGKYKNMRNASKENVERFEKMFRELNYEVHQTKFDHIANDPMYEDCKNTAFYCLLLGQNIDVTGATVQNTQITREALLRGIERLKIRTNGQFDLLGVDVDPDKKSAAQLAMSEIVVKFDAVAEDLAAMMASISTDYRKVMQQEGREDMDGGESSSSYDENFFKWSYEFDKFDKTTSRVKFFFATLADLQYADDNNTTFKYATNGMGMPQLIPMNYVFNEVLSNLWDVDTIEEVMCRLSNLALLDPMYAQIELNLRKVINGVTNPDGTTNADNEALLALLMTTIRSNRHTFMLMRAVSDAKGIYNLVLLRSDADYNARMFPLQWSQVLAKGGSETLKINKYGKIVFNKENRDAANTFSRIGKFLEDLRLAVSSVNNGVYDIPIPQYVYPTYEYEDSIGNKSISSAYFEDEIVSNITEPKGCDRVKTAFVEALNRIGINMHREEFDYMLNHKYGSSDWTALQQMMQSTDETDSIGSFIFFLNNIVKGGLININSAGEFLIQRGKQVPLEQIFSEIAFVKELGNWKYEYRHAHDQLSVLATGGNRFYEISDNDYMSDVIRSCNKRGKWFEDIKKDPYNYFVGEYDNFGERRVYGSITLEQLSNDPDLKIALKHFIGFKTDKRGDEGQDYFEISKREDYLSKIGILENDGMVSLTLSDKKKYCYITGIKLPGIDYSDMRKHNGNFIDPTIAKYLISEPDKVASAFYTVQQREDVVDRFISYAKAEYESILRNAVRLKDGHRKIDNFDTKEQSVMFSSLLGVWEPTYDNDGNVTGEQYISFHDSNKSWEENLSIAEAYFFDRSVDEQRALIGRILSKLTEKELANAVKLGLIEVAGNKENPFKNYKNKGLNNVVISSMKKAYLAANLNLTDDEAESMAITMYINDISNKAIMSGQEMERLFSGNPAFYKWGHEDGKLVDRTVDELKRLGGLGSTGINNFTQLTNIPERYKDGKYRCAEVDNEEVSSRLYEEVKTSMYEGMLRQEIIDATITVAKSEEYKNHFEILDHIRENADPEDKKLLIAEETRRLNDALKDIEDYITSRIDELSIKELEKQSPETAASVRKKADEVSDKFAKGIDVADGGAYISDEMCEMLLRMEGAYGDDILEAFKILRGETKSDYLGLIEAYQKVLTSVIGNQKYTAFGRRFENGNSVPYYHKMALFPIFECIATGRMKNVFDKMKEQKIDMLLVKSAVKVGGEGSKPINWTDYREDSDPSNESNFKGDIANQDWKPSFKDAFDFNTYECEFDYLRKLLNTDPKEEDMLRMGTLMLKIVFSNLMPGRTYTTQDGETKTGRELLQRIMDSSNLLSNLGVDKVNKRFFVTNEYGKLLDSNGNIIYDEFIDGRTIPARNSSKRVLDIEKFSNEVRKMMSDRGADKNILKALEIVTSESTNQKRLRIPLGAISNGAWLESVLISELNKEIVDVNTPGAFFIQRSAWAMEGMKMYDGKKSVKGDKESRQLYNGKPLLMVNEEGSMDCVLSIDFFRGILPQVWSGEYITKADPEIESAIKYYEKELNNPDSNLSKEQINSRLQELYEQREDYIYQRGPNGSYEIDKYGNPVPKKKMRDMTFDEAKDWLIKKGIIGPKAKANIVAYRIPTQAESSIHALRCVDVLPVVRDTVILPQEFTRITGSDFDIDKLGLSMLNYPKNGKSEFKEGSEKYYQNLLIKDYITLLIDKRSQHILHRPIDCDTKLLKDVLREIELESGVEETPYGFYSLSTQTERKDDYITGKIGIGPFALNNNNHILTMLYGVRFKDFDDSIMSVLGLTDLSTNKDEDGNSIMSWLSALINAHVDIAKDPYISRLNVNRFTYNLVNTLIRTGFGKKTFYLTTQPIMKELADAYNRAGSAYMLDSNKSVWKLQKEAVEETAKARFKDVKINGWTFDELVNGLSDPKNTEYNKTINEYIYSLFENYAFKYNANKEYDSTTGFTVHVGEEDDFSEKAFVHLDPELTQMLVYLAYILMEPYATSVSNLVKYSKIDTKKHGKSYIEQQVYLRGFDDLFDNPDGTGLFEETGLKKMAKESYIRLKTENAISMTKAILKDQFLQSSNAFDNAIQAVLNMIGRSNSKSVDLWETISKILNASVKSEFINSYARSLPQYTKSYMRDLVTESEDDLEYTQKAGTNRLKVVGTPKYPLKSYINGGTVNVKFDYENKERMFTYNIIGYDEEANELIVDSKRKIDNSGKMHLVGGKNTIYDRFLNMYLDLKDDPAYRDMLDSSGEPINRLLRSLVVGKTFEYTKPTELLYITKHEAPDTYPNLKFIKLFNALDQNGIESNYIIDGWDALLHDEAHPKLKRFAEDLVVYAFITSGDQGGFTKFFKQVPLSWRIESGYSDFVFNKLIEFKSEDISGSQLEDAILNNWFDNQIIPTYYLDTKGVPNFISYYNNNPSTGIPRASYPTILAALRVENNGMLTPTMDIESAPLYIKVPRRNEKEARDSQRRYTVFRRISYGMQRSVVTGKDEKGNEVTLYDWVHYPIYVKVEPKGNLLRGNFLITEYGREDSTNKEYAPSQEGLKALYKIGDFISESTIEEYKPKYGELLTLLIEDMNYRDMFENTFGGNMAEFEKALPRRKNPNYKGVTKVISGGQTGVDTIGLEVARSLGIETGGTITPGFYREKGVDSYTREQLEEFGLQEISPELQGDKSGKEFYRPRTEQNVINSDGTVYFTSNADDHGGGRGLTEGFAKKHNKPFILNPTAEELRKWLEDNNISVLNVAGNRGSRIGDMRDSVVNTLNKALKKEDTVEAPVQQTVENKPSIDSTSDRMGSDEENKKTLESGNTILSNEELKEWNKAGVGPNPRILVASERTDPAFHVLQILDILDGKESVEEWGIVDGKRQVVGNISGKDFAGLYLITKHDGLPMERLLKTKIPKLIHFSITGLGGTKYEPGVMKPDDLLDRIEEYIKMGLDPNSVTIRIDPIVPGITTTNMIRNIIHRASGMGINRIRFSIMDAYPNTVASLSGTGYDFERNYGINPKTGKPNFNAKPEIINKIVDFMLQMKELYGVSLGTCAEGLVRPGISKEGCLSVESVNRMLGTSIPDKGTKNNNQRQLCSCYGGKIDALKYNAACASHCVYCYAKHENDKALQYYNEDGTLKRTVYTETTYSKSARELSNKSAKLVEYERFFNNPLNSRFEKLAKVVFNLIDKFGIEIEHDQNLEVLGRFVRGYNKILIKPGHLSENTLLHECIHAVTSYYADIYESDKKSLSKEIQTAIEELKYCYKLLKDDAYETGALTKDGVLETYELAEPDKYGLTNLHEFIAELSNPDFIGRIKDYDSRHDSSVFNKLIDIIARILGIKKEYKDVMTTSYLALKVLLESPDKALYDRRENEIRTMKDNLNKIRTNTTLYFGQHKGYKPIIDAIENSENGKNITVIVDVERLKFDILVPNVKNNKIEKGSVISVGYEGNNGYIVLTKDPIVIETGIRDDGTDYRNVEFLFSVLTVEFLSNNHIYILSDGDSLTRLNEESLDLLLKVYKNRKNNTEENRKRAESYVKSKTSGIYKLKDKQFAAWRAVGLINDILGTTFLVEVNKTTLGISVPSKLATSLKNSNTIDAKNYTLSNKIDSIFTLIANEPSYDSAVQILEQNGYSANDNSVRQALGLLIKQICKGGK